MEEYLYDAFISYSHRDMKWGRWLQRKLEGFHCPKEAAGETGRARRLKIFRDQTDLTGTELTESLNRELGHSRYLIVICSPASAASRWVNEEIRSFCALGRKDRIIPFIVAGEPASDRAELECFPPMLRGEELSELLGVNIQEIGKDKAFLKTASVLLDIRFNRLVDREKQRRRRTVLTSTALTVVIAGVTGFLIWRNTRVTEENKALTFDIYGAAMKTLQMNENLQPEELAFLEASAKAGNDEAMIYLADCCLHGWGMEADPETGFRWFGKAAEKGNTQGMIGVANCYLNGTGTEKDWDKAFSWYQQAAEQGDPAAMFNLAGCYLSGIGTTADAAKAIEWYKKAALKDYDLAMYNLGVGYLTGTGTEPNEEQGVYWMRRFAETGNPNGMCYLGLMYREGAGVEKDPQEAYKWFRKAADAGNPDGMFWVGWCIENQFGTENQALEWYERAAEAGNEEAREAAERIRTKRETTEGDRIPEVPGFLEIMNRTKEKLE